MPPGAGLAPQATVFVCLSVYLESGNPMEHFSQELDFSKSSHISLLENIS